MKKKDIEYIKKIAVVLEKISEEMEEMEEGNVSLNHLTMLKDIGSTLLFISVKEGYA